MFTHTHSASYVPLCSTVASTPSIAETITPTRMPCQSHEQRTVMSVVGGPKRMCVVVVGHDSANIVFHCVPIQGVQRTFVFELFVRGWVSWQLQSSHSLCRRLGVQLGLLAAPEQQQSRRLRCCRSRRCAVVVTGRDREGFVVLGTGTSPSQCTQGRECVHSEDYHR